MGIICQTIDSCNDELFSPDLVSEEDNRLLDYNYDNIIIFKLNENNRLQEEIFVV